jgi:hypothetical protein
MFDRTTCEGMSIVAKPWVSIEALNELRSLISLNKDRFYSEATRKERLLLFKGGHEDVAPCKSKKEKSTTEPVSSTHSGTELASARPVDQTGCQRGIDPDDS